MKKSKFTLNDILYNNRILLVFSVFIAVVIWVIIAVEFTPETTVTIKNVPVKIDTSFLKNTLSLDAYGEEGLTVDVTIVGKRYIVEDDDIINDIEVSANLGSVNHGGETFVLPIEVGSVSTRPEYEIVSISVDSVSVFFDVESSKKVPVRVNLVVDEGIENLAKEGYFACEPAPELDMITIYGPESEIDEISEIVAQVDTKGGLTENTNLQANLILQKNNGQAPKYVEVNSSSTVNVLVPVYKSVECDVECSFTGIPEAYMPSGYTQGDYFSDADKSLLPFTYFVSPGTEYFGFKKEKDRTDRTIVIGEIDFSEIKPGTNELTFVFEDDELNAINSDNTEFVVTIEAHNVVFGTPLELPETMKLLDGSGEAEILEGVGTTIQVVGPAGSVALLTADNFALDYSKATSNNDGTVTVPVVLVGADDCWICGKYSAVIEVIN